MTEQQAKPAIERLKDAVYRAFDAYSIEDTTEKPAIGKATIRVSTPLYIRDSALKRSLREVITVIEFDRFYDEDRRRHVYEISTTFSS